MVTESLQFTEKKVKRERLSAHTASINSDQGKWLGTQTRHIYLTGDGLQTHAGNSVVNHEVR